MVEILLSELGECLGGGIGQASMERLPPLPLFCQQRRREPFDLLEFTGRVDRTVSAQNGFDQGGSGPGHPHHKERSLANDTALGNGRVGRRGLETGFDMVHGPSQIESIAGQLIGLLMCGKSGSPFSLLVQQVAQTMETHEPGQNGIGRWPRCLLNGRVLHSPWGLGLHLSQTDGIGHGPRVMTPLGVDGCELLACGFQIAESFGQGGQSCLGLDVFRLQR